jgi:phospholipid transport system substrate-binding protein
MFRTLPKTLSIAALTASFFIGGLSPAWAGEPTDYIKKSSQEVSKVLRQKESKKRHEEFSAKVNQIVDFKELAARALADHWEKRTPEEQQTFLSLLQELLEANYQEKLEGKTLGEDYEIEYLDEKTRDKLAIVKTKVKWDEGQKPASYKLMKKENGWVVYDIIIDDISLVETYRDAYTEIIETEGWDELISRMQQKAEQLRDQKE